MQFPRHVFRDGGKHQRAAGHYSTELAQDAAHHDELLAAGWHATLPDAIAAAAAPVTQTAPAAESKAAPTRDEIVQKLEELNVVFDRRLGDKKLAALLDETLKK